MKKLIQGAMLLIILIMATSSQAWDGFDADSADLIEIDASFTPKTGDVIQVLNHDANTTTQFIVVSVRHNLRTTEVVATDPDNTLHTFVMEGR